jgi:hypothetical protein
LAPERALRGEKVGNKARVAELERVAEESEKTR